MLPAQLQAHVNSEQCAPTSSTRNPFVIIERIGNRFARQRSLVLLLVAMITVVLRLSLLGLDPVPLPAGHDEFSYLLAGDTFAHGRLTNPSHPLSLFFDTLHVIQQPTYMSKYPPAQGLVLALGQRMGDPWIGVILSVATMSVVVTWMLEGWLPSNWALLGGVLLAFRFATFNYWMDSYWGGAVAATGGALVMGALPRLIRLQRSVYSVILGVGLVILANSRPAEGLIFSLPVAGMLCIWLLRAVTPWRQKLRNVIVPLAAILMTGFMCMGYYNWRGTGNPLLFPYVVDQRAHLTTPLLLFQSPPHESQFLIPQFTEFNRVIREEYVEHRTHFIRSSETRIWTLFSFLCGPLLLAPVLTVHRLLADRRLRILVVQVVISVLALLITTFFEVHYAAPLLATILVLALQGLRFVRQWHIRDFAIGTFLSRSIVVVCLFVFPAHVGKAWYEARHGITWTDGRMAARAKIMAKLETLSEPNLMIVRYSAEHNPHEEWVYNSADIDNSKIVWAREIPGVSLDPLLKYFHARKVWVVEPDSPNIQLRPYLDVATQ